MAHITIIRIKNSDFDYTKYGLKNNYFSLDVTTNIGYSKNTGTTQYAVLDGTTRLDNISKQPGDITLQGLLGELRAGNNPEHFAYNTAERNRLQNQMDLLEALRDQAIFVDFITDERTYRNYIITGCTFGKSAIGKIDANITSREAILFGDDVNFSTNNALLYISDYEKENILSKFTMNSIESDDGLIDETNRIITGSILSSPFITVLGPIGNNPDVVIPTYTFKKYTTKTTLPTSAGASVTVTDTTVVTNNNPAAEIYTGVVADGNYLQLTIPLIPKDTFLYSQKIRRNSDGSYNYSNIGKYRLDIALKNNNENLYSFGTTDLLKTPLYSDIVNGIHSLSVVGSNSDIISSARFGLNFIRKQKNDNYTIKPNLLGGTNNRGYLYNATYETPFASSTILSPMLVYIHPEAWTKIKRELYRVWDESNYFKTKTLGGRSE